jgi:nicotinate-nucleotide--dimethylbenzimidazole phosphoribosyltransferase
LDPKPDEVALEAPAAALEAPLAAWLEPEAATEETELASEPDMLEREALAPEAAEDSLDAASLLAEAAPIREKRVVEPIVEVVTALLPDEMVVTTALVVKAELEAVVAPLEPDPLEPDPLVPEVAEAETPEAPAAKREVTPG